MTSEQKLERRRRSGLWGGEGWQCLRNAEILVTGVILRLLGQSGVRVCRASKT